MRAALSLALTAVLLSAGPLAEASFAATPSCCGPESPCAPAASAPAPAAISRPAGVSRLPMPVVATPAALLFDPLEHARGRRPELSAFADFVVRPPETSLRL